MDRLQAAIRQARAARDAVLARSATMPEVDEPTGEALMAWAGLDAFEPDPRHLERNRIVTREDGPRSAPFDVLRTRILQQAETKGYKRIAITSPGPGCGKSTVTLNLALSLARQTDVRTIVVDLDLRRPMLARLLGLDGEKHIPRAIVERADPAGEMTRLGDNLAIASTARAVRDPSALIHGRSMAQFLDRLADQFEPDLILLDLPPVMVSDDAIAFMPNADAAMIVAAAEQSTLRQVDACERDLAAQTNVLGVVLNKCAHPGDGHAYGYGYGYGYGASA
ncbi:CpsD/CapB family tyrosine-protein kinase [Jannaschia ovalis]|uniref:CpsD/CapB family tyrosine-protein kinase n=1 Tax=Jannaschia ovalis TaxID=3038773 RepID=A0ABY8L7C1_9RHOB|nr:CpsD/CapB family tyrosine-protein kinase [Jannaschia sp. GRR-S6-38]WGH77272.1 CpsD/CapB family tyrosine-protein kinase [Jannaschia sp. GRR-S6-38]